MPLQEVYLADYPRLSYAEALDLQRRVLSAKIEGDFPDTLILLEHPPVITLGRRGRLANILVSDDILQKEGIQVFHVERGGDVTYHGPGQIVGYPIFALENYGKDLARFVSSIEEILIRVCRDLGVEAVREPMNRGVWVGGKKIASIGLAIRKWISFHGFAFNWAPNQRHLQFITPCGLSGIELTSVSEILRKEIDSGMIRKRICRHFETVFGIRLCEVDLTQKLTHGGTHEDSKGSPIYPGP